MSPRLAEVLGLLRQLVIVSTAMFTTLFIISALTQNTSTANLGHQLAKAYKFLLGMIVQCVFWVLVTLTNLFALLTIAMIFAFLFSMGKDRAKSAHGTTQSTTRDSTATTSDAVMNMYLASVNQAFLFTSFFGTLGFGSAILQVPRGIPVISGAVDLLAGYMLGSLKLLSGIFLVIILAVTIKYCSQRRPSLDSGGVTLTDIEVG